MTSIIIQGHQEIAVISIISGSLIEVISGINFYLYGKTTSQMSEFQTRLEMIQRYLLANSICEGLKGDHKQESRKELVRVIAEGASTREEVVTKTE